MNTEKWNNFIEKLDIITKFDKLLDHKIFAWPTTDIDTSQLEMLKITDHELMCFNKFVEWKTNEYILYIGIKIPHLEFLKMLREEVTQWMDDFTNSDKLF